MLAQPAKVTKPAAASHTIATFFCIAFSLGFKSVGLSAWRSLPAGLPGEPLLC
jgi:hypothetical protein